MTIDILEKEAVGMSEETLMEVVRFMRFIKLKDLSTKSTEKKASKVLRSGGKYRGQGWMADDFDEPLEEFREYM